MSIRSYLKKSISCTVTTCLTAGLLIPAVSVLADQASEVSLDAFADPVIREKLSGEDYDKDQNGILSAEEIADIKDLAIHDGGINTTEGLENLTSLERLNLCGSNITEIDLSSFPNLNTLEIFGNPLTELDLSGLSELFYLDVHDTGITSLDVSDCPKIADAVDNGTYHEELSYSDAYCYEGSEGYVIFDYGLVFSTGIIQGTDESDPTETDQTDPTDSTDPEDIIEINEELFPDEVLRNYIVDNYDYDNDGFLNETEISEATFMNICQDGVHSLNGLELFYNLKSFYASDNYINEIDVSNLSKLEILYIPNNGITELDISNNPCLRELTIYGNQIKEIDITEQEGLQLAYTDGYRNYDAYVYEDDDCNYYTLEFDEDVKLIVGGEWINMPEGTWLIDGINFPDIAFRNIILNDYDTNSDEILDMQEISNVSVMDVSGQGISSLKGIEVFSYLTELDCSNNTLIELNISSNTRLCSLDAQGNQIVAIDFSSNDNLKTAVLDGDCLGEWCYEYDSTDQYGHRISLEVYLDESVAIFINGDWVNAGDTSCEINEENFPDDNFRSIVSSYDKDGDGFLSMEEIEKVYGIDCSRNSICSLEGIEHFTALTSLQCQNNNLTHLDLSGNPSLCYLDCSNNKLTDVDISSNTQIYWLSFNNNKLTSIDVSRMTLLYHFDIRSNKIEQLDISGLSNLVLAFRYGDFDSYNKYYDYWNQETGDAGYLALELSVEIYVDGEMINDPVGYGSVCAIDDDTFPDNEFKWYVFYNIDTDQDGYLYEDEIDAVTELNLKDKYIYSLVGIEYFTSLEKLDCSSEHLTSLDLSANTELKELNCSNNELTSLVLPFSTKLVELKCYENHLTFIDLSNNTGLETLNCDNNQLSSLDLSSNTELTSLSCSGYGTWKWDSSVQDYVQVVSGMSIGELDLSNNQKLQYLNASYSGLTDLILGSSNITEITCHHNSLETLDISMCKDIKVCGCVDNQITELDITNNENLILAFQNGINQHGYYEYHDAANNKDCYFEFDPTVKLYADGEWINGLDGLCVIDEDSFPDETFRNYVLEEIDTDEDQVLSEEEAAEVEELDVFEMNITTLEGIEYFTSLQALDCAGNELTSLDLSANTALVELNCAGNELTDLEIGEGSSLTYLVCMGNELTELDISQLEQLSEVYCQGNQITDLHLPSQGCLTILSCYDNQLEEVNLDGQSSLLELNCSGNKLTDIDLSECPLLQLLYIFDNDLSTLDLECVPELYDLECSNNPLEALDVSGNSKLSTIFCNGCGLTSIDISGCPDLESLGCSRNALTKLDISKNTKLEFLKCNGNQINKLDISNNPSLLNSKIWRCSKTNARTIILEIK